MVRAPLATSRNDGHRSASGNSKRGEEGFGDSDRISLIEIFEFLIAHGHREDDLWAYSPEKIELFFELASKRLHRASAIEDIRQLEVLTASISGVMGGRQQFDEVLESRKKVLSAGPPDKKKNMKTVINKLRAAGVRTKNG